MLSNRISMINACFVTLIISCAVTSSSADELLAVIAPNMDLKQVAPVPHPVPTGDARIIDGLENPDGEIGATEDSKFVILGSEIAKGTSTRLAWSTDGDTSDLSTPAPVMVIRGNQPGKTMCMTAAVHGDELNGIEIVRRVMFDIEPESLTGNIIGIPIVNLQGFHRGSRYLSDRRDLNRFFPGDANGSLASRMAYSLFHEVIRHCDFLIDIHTGSLRRTNLPQIRADLRNNAVAELTRGFDKMAVMHNSARPGMLRYAALQQGIPAVTLEVGESLRIQKDKIESAVSSINHLLERQGMYSRLFIWGEPEPVYYSSAWIRTERSGILFSNKQLGEMVEKGELLGTVTDPITNESGEIISTLEGRIIGMAVNQFVMPGFAAYHIGIESSGEVLAGYEENENPLP